MVPIAFNAAGASAANASIVRDTVGSEAQPLTSTVAVVSVGGVLLLELDDEEDVKAETDMNVVCTGGGRFVEVQGTAESSPSTAPNSTPCSARCRSEDTSVWP